MKNKQPSSEGRSRFQREAGSTKRKTLIRKENEVDSHDAPPGFEEPKYATPSRASLSPRSSSEVSRCTHSDLPAGDIAASEAFARLFRSAVGVSCVLNTINKVKEWDSTRDAQLAKLLMDPRMGEELSNFDAENTSAKVVDIVGALDTLSPVHITCPKSDTHDSTKHQEMLEKKPESSSASYCRKVDMDVPPPVAQNPGLNTAMSLIREYGKASGAIMVEKPIEDCGSYGNNLVAYGQEPYLAPSLVPNTVEYNPFPKLAASSVSLSRGNAVTGVQPAKTTNANLSQHLTKAGPPLHSTRPEITQVPFQPSPFPMRPESHKVTRRLSAATSSTGYHPYQERPYSFNIPTQFMSVVSSSPTPQDGIAKDKNFLRYLVRRYGGDR